ncbi:MAG: hypothetical protein ACFB15_28100 [Cyclobacteriaceae bacterium]
MQAQYLILILASFFISFHSHATYQVTIEPKEGEAFSRAEYTLWIPEGLDRVQHIILH